MNCFVIMPFAPEFDDVYEAIRASVLGATSSAGSRCFRLDDAKPAGRITDRLLRELNTASLCVADLTGCRPNVMWEVGFAMALQCPTIIVTQSLAGLPFDIRGMQSLEYDRERLSRTLAQPLRAMVVDTLSAQEERRKGPDNEELVGELLAEVADLKSMMAQAVQSWNPVGSRPRDVEANRIESSHLEGAWISEESGSHLYARVIGDELIGPYCYRGDDRLIGVYFAWRKTGPYWFARYAWLMDDGPNGFAFLRHESVDVLRGAWWGDHGEGDALVEPPDRAGVLSTWRRLPDKECPSWADRFFEDVQREGLQKRLTRRLSANVSSHLILESSTEYRK